MPYLRGEAFPPAVSVASCASGSSVATAQNPPIAWRESVTAGEQISAFVGGTLVPLSSDPKYLWHVRRLPSTRGLASPRFGKLCMLRIRIVARCRCDRGGGHALPHLISTGFSAYPPVPLKRAWCSCTGRSLLDMFSATCCAPASQPGRGLMLIPLKRSPSGKGRTSHDTVRS